MHTLTPVVLAIEDNLAIRRFLKTSLISQKYQFIESGTGHGGLDLIAVNKPDIVLLDLGLPDIDGLTVIRKLREWTAIPIIVLSARDQEHHKIQALDIGADDYLTKPFSIGELNARLRVALRHAERINETETPTYEIGHLRIDLLKHEVWLANKKITLSPIQYGILSVLVRRANKIVTHKQLLKEVWGENHTQDIDYLRIYIHQLRHKLEKNPAQPKYFKTEPGIGYRLVSDVQT